MDESNHMHACNACTRYITLRTQNETDNLQCQSPTDYLQRLQTQLSDSFFSSRYLIAN